MTFYLTMCQWSVSIWWLFCVHAVLHIYQQTMNLEVLRICSVIPVLVTSSTHSNCRVIFYTIISTKQKNVTIWLPLNVQPRSCALISSPKPWICNQEPASVKCLSIISCFAFKDCSKWHNEPQLWKTTWIQLQL